MDNEMRVNSAVFNYEAAPLFTWEYASNVIVYNTFSTAQSNTSLWIPATGKKIYLTAIEASALAALTVTLSRAGNAPFLVMNLTSTFATYSESFSSPVRFAPGERISLTTSASGTMNITLFGYEV